MPVPIKKISDLTSDQKQKIIEMYDGGTDIKEIAKTFNLSPITVRRVLEKEDIPILDEEKEGNMEEKEQTTIAKKILDRKEAQDVKKAVQNIGSVTSYKIYRYSEDGPDRNFIGKFTEKEIEAYKHDFETFIQKNFGGGHYDIELYGSDQTNPLTVRTVKIEGEPKKPGVKELTPPMWAEPNRLIIKEIERRDEEFKRREEKYESMLNKVMEELRRKDEEIDKLRREMMERESRSIEQKIEEIKQGKQSTSEVLAEAIKQLPALLETFRPKTDTQFEILKFMLEMKKSEEERLQRERELARQESNRVWEIITPLIPTFTEKLLTPQKNPELIELERDLKELQKQLNEPAVDPLTETMRETFGELLKSTVENMTKQPPVTTSGVPATQGAGGGVIGQVIAKLVEAIPAVSESISKAIKEKAYIQKTGKLPGEQFQVESGQSLQGQSFGNLGKEELTEIQRDSIAIASEIQNLYRQGASVEQVGEYIIDTLTKLGNQSKAWELLISNVVDNPEANISIFNPFFTGFDPEFKKNIYSYLLKRIEEEKEKASEG
jgi:hypothetical protein